MSYGSDILICLDYCTHADEPLSVQREAVARTIDWAKRCKSEFEAGLARRGISESQKPMLFAVIQGGGYRDLRKECAEELMKMGFDGFAFGGWPLDGAGNLLTEILAYTRELVPESYPMHALGVGQPANIVECVRIGYNLFDSVMPTRDARHGRLYSLETDPASPSGGFNGRWYSYVYIQDKKHIRDASPVSEHCDCLCCSNYSLAYLRHLFTLGDGLFARLATIHNLRFMTQLMERLRAYETRSNPGG
jgi:queuine tRNA-ribosyltransferase